MFIPSQIGPNNAAEVIVAEAFTVVVETVLLEVIKFEPDVVAQETTCVISLCVSPDAGFWRVREYLVPAF